MTNALPAPLADLSLQQLAFTVEEYLPQIPNYSSREDHYDLDAPYQRPSVWTVEQRRALIKSLLMDLPVGAVTAAELPYDGSYCTTPNRFRRVIDGQQRIRAVRAFVAGEFAVPGWWFEPRAFDDPEARARDVVWADLSHYGRRVFLNTQLPMLKFRSHFERRRDPATGDWIRSEITDPRTGRVRDGGAKEFPRTFEGALAAEAEVFLLLNGGGTSQTDEHMARVAEMAEEWSK